jgi:hypothetical protein
LNGKFNINVDNNTMNIDEFVKIYILDDNIEKY